MLNKEMLFFLKSLSRTVHDHHDSDHQQEEHINEEANKINVVGDGTSTSFTVWRKSLLISCSGFTVIDSNGDLVYRVDNYTLRPRELVLMDASGKSILTMHRRKKLGVSENWEVYEGDQASGSCTSTTTTILDHQKKPIALWRVKKNKKNILEVLFNNNMNKNVVLAHVLRSGSRQCSSSSSYVIEGCYKNRSCKVIDIETRRVMAETKRKKNIINGGISFGEDVFVLVVNFGFDPSLAMALVLLLDQMFS